MNCLIFGAILALSVTTALAGLKDEPPFFGSSGPHVAAVDDGPSARSMFYSRPALSYPPQRQRYSSYDYNSYNDGGYGGLNPGYGGLNPGFGGGLTGGYPYYNSYGQVPQRVGGMFYNGQYQRPYGAPGPNLAMGLMNLMRHKQSRQMLRRLIDEEEESGADAGADAEP